ncbi:glucocorticoid modulatory element-binding protein 1-like isoform X1 [Girardinichthys multiradiatus]|uniref:glucocorticoid modulatory element-binding protein 1-like isoform X1 n=1 Tax=Girardinichthys multiradiatus TaxID=208333 RepID=UPI001FAC6C15|nr:glucocorticoid modulatory element-binding protein 1-like isoform X1 [Girardinichthys multiradiatus]XP_047216191.1 glucocorticoid modulatory element-binding protein 1-like isoform X1 [Girardinichthys multiradiatus]
MMASAAEVTEPSGQVMMVTTEDEGCRGNDHRRQVILQLNGPNDDPAGIATTVLAIETHQSDYKAEGTEIEYGYPITCGDSRAVLLFKKFICPGINVRCVKFNDQLISPKQFVHLAGKATLKDWKRAIRVGGVMLRKMMDSGQIDFYQHESMCSNTCRSTKFDVLMNSTQPPLGTLVQPSLLCLPLEPVGGQLLPVTEFSSCNGSSLDGVLSLWQSVAESGLMGDVLSGLDTKLGAALKGVELRSRKGSLQETDAHILNSLCEMFGLLDSVKQALVLRCTQNQERNIHHVLDEIPEEHRKQSCNQSRSYKTSSFKHLRPHRQSPQKRCAHYSLSIERTNSATYPLSFTGLSAASHVQVFSHFSAPPSRGHLAGASRTDGVGQNNTSGKNKNMK